MPVESNYSEREVPRDGRGSRRPTKHTDEDENGDAEEEPAEHIDAIR